MRRDVVAVGLLWILATLLGEYLVSTVDLYPPRAALEAEHIDQAIRTLLMLAVPVFTFVVVVMLYSIWRFRARDETEVGEPIYTHKAFTIGWLVVTAALAGVLFYNPGYVGWKFLKSNPTADLEIQVTAAQWHWHITYPAYDLSLKSRPIGFARQEENTVMALPAGKRVKFVVTSDDVIHSFWIPALRMKIDAVPGMTTTMYVTITETGSYQEDAAFRVQCAELCGTGHPRMTMPVVILEPEEFEHWVKQQKEKQMGSTDEHQN